MHSYTLLTDSGTYSHRYSQGEVSYEKLDLLPYVTEFIIEPNFNAIWNYYLRPGGPTNEQKFMMRLDTFKLKSDDAYTLQFGSLGIRITELTQNHMVAFRNGLERHYRKINNGL